MSRRNTTNTQTRGSESYGSRRSAARVKPVRGAAKSVRTAPKVVKRKTRSRGMAADPYAGMSKTERRAARRERRIFEDRVIAATNIVLRDDALYVRRRRICLVLMAVGFVVVLLTLLLLSIFPRVGTNVDTPLGVGLWVLLIASYLLVFIAILFDYIRVRPLRKQAEQVVRAMTDKKRAELVEAEYARRSAARAAKKKGALFRRRGSDEHKDTEREDDGREEGSTE